MDEEPGEISGAHPTIAEKPSTRVSGSGVRSSARAPSERPPAGGRPSDRPSASLGGAERSLGGTLAVATTRDAMRAEEVGRIRQFSRIMIALALGGAALLPLLPGDPVAERVALGSIALIGATYLWLHQATGHPATFSAAKLGFASQLLAAASTGVAYYFGVYSPFPAIVAVGIFLYSLGGPLRYALANCLMASVTHGGVVALILAGVVEDRGLITADGQPLSVRVAAQACVLLVYGLAFGTGRMSRGQTQRAVSELERAVRQVAQREALLEEARQELERAAWIGGPGRFTEQVLGSYRLGVVIGRGAMGEIYEARDLETGAPAAVKLLTRASLGHPAHRARFIREARIASSLSSPNVVRVLEVAETGAALPYIAMELLEGDDLGSLLRKRSRLPLDAVVDLVRQVAAGLVAASEAGIVHRDLKPQNLFLHRPGSSGPVWKILDFGVSKLEEQGGTLTEGFTVGTPGYMAPEQAAGEDVDVRADVHGLAVIAYRALTGHPPYPGKRVPQVMHDVVHKMPVRPGELVEIHADVDSVLALGLAKDPADRFGTADALARAFVEAVHGELDAALRRRAGRVLAAHPWGAER